MVIREYQCSGCNETHDYLLMQDEEPSECAGCHGPTSGLRKLISAPNIVSSNKTGGFGNPKYLNKGAVLNISTGEVMFVGVTRELRRDGSPFVDVDAVNLETDKKVVMKDVLGFDIK